MYEKCKTFTWGKFSEYQKAALIHVPQRVSTGLGGRPIEENFRRRSLFFTTADLIVAIKVSTRG